MHEKKLNETSLCLSQSSPTGSHARRGRLRQNCTCNDFFSFAFESPRSFSLFKISLLQKSLKASLDFCDFSSYFRKYSSADVSLSLFLFTKQALERYEIEKDIAAYIKKEFDKKYQPTWHCVVGRNFGSYVTHETGHFIYFYIGHIAILLFRSG